MTERLKLLLLLPNQMSVGVLNAVIHKTHIKAANYVKDLINESGAYQLYDIVMASDLSTEKKRYSASKKYTFIR